jgi:hypothetical protein
VYLSNIIEIVQDQIAVRQGVQNDIEESKKSERKTQTHISPPSSVVLVVKLAFLTTSLFSK